MAAAVSGVVNGSQMTITGSGVTGTDVYIIVQFTGPVHRRYAESYRVFVTGGNVSYVANIPHGAGTYVVKLSDTAGNLLATSSNIVV